MTEMHSRTASAAQASKPGGSNAADVAVNVGVLLLGVVLGMFNLASNAENSLRIPALLAAMLLFASSLSEIVYESKTAAADDDEPEEDVPAGRAVMRGSSMPPAAGPPARSPMIPILVLSLAIWVGIAALLNPEAEQTLRGLSLLAAFLLCYNAISELRQGDG